MYQTGKIALILTFVTASLFVLSTAVAQESTEAEMSDDKSGEMSSEMEAEEEVVELEEQVVIGSRARPPLCYRFSRAD